MYSREHLDSNPSYGRFGDERYHSSYNDPYHVDLHYGYKPPEVAQTPRNPERRSPFHSINSSDLIIDDISFYHFGECILYEVEKETSSISRGREKSIAIAVQLNEMLSMKELIDFNNSLKLRLKKFGPPHRNMSQLEELVHDCDRVFGDELRQMVYHKAPISSSHPPSHFKMEHYHDMSSTPKSQNVLRFSYPEKPKLDLTNYVIQNEISASPKEPQFSVGNVETLNSRIQSNGTSITAMSTASDDMDDHVYTIDVQDVIKGLSPRVKKNIKDVRYSDFIRAQSNRNQRTQIPTPTKKATILHKSRREVQVMAPATLPENFVFEARMGDEIFMVVVVSYDKYKNFQFLYINKSYF